MRLARILTDGPWPVLCRTVERGDGRMTLFPNTMFAPPDRFRLEFLATGEVVTVTWSSSGGDGIDVAVVESAA